MVGRVNDCALVTLTRAIKTPVLQVSHDVESMSFLFQQLPHLGDTFTTVSALWGIDLLEKYVLLTLLACSIVASS